MIKTAIKVYSRLRHKVTEIYNHLKLNRYENVKGRKLSIPVPDAITLSLWKQKQNIKTKKSLFEIIAPSCSYKTLVVSLNAAARLVAIILATLLRMNQKDCHPIKFHDSTDIEVCKLRKSHNHKTLAALSSYSKTGKGWFYGLKLHLTSDFKGTIVNVRLTSAKASDRKMLKEMNRKLKGIFVTDAGYISKELEKEFNPEDGRLLMTVPRANMKKLATAFQIFLQRSRMRIELHFRNLKLFFGLETGLPRSIDGYLGNYLSSLVSYMTA